MTEDTGNEVRAGLREVLPVILAVVPFGMVYGALAIDAGLSVVEALGLSAAVYAGASQFVALQMIGLGAPVWSICIAVFALNFRHVLYSATVGRHLGRFSAAQKAGAFFLLVDPAFASAEARAATRPLTPAFYFAYGIALYVAWLASTWLGTLFGSVMGDTRLYGLDFILPAYFATLLATFRRRALFLPVVLLTILSAGLVYVTLGSPWHVTVGGFGGILYAAFRPPAAAAEETRDA